MRAPKPGMLHGSQPKQAQPKNPQRHRDVEAAAHPQDGRDGERADAAARLEHDRHVVRIGLAEAMQHHQHDRQRHDAEGQTRPSLFHLRDKLDGAGVAPRRQVGERAHAARRVGGDRAQQFAELDGPQPGSKRQ